MNEKIYMSVEQTDRMYKEEKGFHLYNEMLYEDINELVEKFNDKKLVPITDRKCVGVMSIPTNGIRKAFHKFNYVVYYINDNKEFLISSSELKFKDALLLARIVCKQNVCECFIINGQKKIVSTDDKENLNNDYFNAYYDVLENSSGVIKEPSHSDYSRAYHSMKKFTADEPEGPVLIRRRHR